MTRKNLQIVNKRNERVRMGDRLAALGRKASMTDAEIETLRKRAGRAPAEPMKFR